METSSVVSNSRGDGAILSEDCQMTPPMVQGAHSPCLKPKILLQQQKKLCAAMVCIQVLRLLCITVPFVGRIVCGSTIAMNPRVALRPLSVCSVSGPGLSKMNGVGISAASDFSEEEECASSPKNSKSNKILAVSTLQLRSTSGNFEFIFESKNVMFKSVLLCGSWSDWKMLESLSFDSKENCWRGSFSNIPNGIHNFKVPFIFQLYVMDFVHLTKRLAVYRRRAVGNKRLVSCYA